MPTSRIPIGRITIGTLLGALTGFMISDLVISFSCATSSAVSIVIGSSVLGGSFIGLLIAAAIEPLAGKHEGFRDRCNAVCVLIAILTILYFIIAPTFKMN